MTWLDFPKILFGSRQKNKFQLNNTFHVIENRTHSNTLLTSPPSHRPLLIPQTIYITQIHLHHQEIDGGNGSSWDDGGSGSGAPTEPHGALRRGTSHRTSRRINSWASLPPSVNSLPSGSARTPIIDHTLGYRYVNYISPDDGITPLPTSSRSVPSPPFRVWGFGGFCSVRFLIS